MGAWIMLGLAILVEVTGTLALRAAATGHWAWYLVTAPAYVTAFWALSVALSKGLGLGVAYGVWAACGVALTAVAAKLLFGEELTRQMGLGIVLVAMGVLLVEIGADHTADMAAWAKAVGEGFDPSCPEPIWHPPHSRDCPLQRTGIDA